jgi:ferric iron reductase protein FhuF
MEDGMATAGLLAIVEALTSAVDYLRITVGDGPGDWLPCGPLVDDPEHLGATVAGTKQARGTDRDDVATSLFVQGYAFRIATVVVGSWLLADTVVDVAPATTAIALGRGRPNAVRLDAGTAVHTPAGAADVHAALVDGHLAAMVANAHASCRVGAALLWGNVAASIAAAFGAFAAGTPPDEAREIADRAEALLAAAGPEVRDAGRLVRVGDRFTWERHSCCLWYRTESGFMCEDCSLRPRAEHEARYAAMVEVAT